MHWVPHPSHRDGWDVGDPDMRWMGYPVSGPPDTSLKRPDLGRPGTLWGFGVVICYPAGAYYV